MVDGISITKVVSKCSETNVGGQIINNVYSYGVSELVVFKDMNTEVFVVYLIALCLIVKKSCFNKTNGYLPHFRQQLYVKNTQC